MWVTATKSSNAGPKHGRLWTSTAIFILLPIVCNVPLVRDDLSLRCLFVSLASLALLLSMLFSARTSGFPPSHTSPQSLRHHRDPSCDGVIPVRVAFSLILDDIFGECPSTLLGGLCGESAAWTPHTSEPLSVSDVPSAMNVPRLCRRWISPSSAPLCAPVSICGVVNA